jgi:subtilisin family serine protease
MDGRHSHIRRAAAALIAALPVVAAMPAAHAAAAPAPETVTVAPAHGPMVGVIVRTSAEHLALARHLVDELGGRITLDLGIIDGFAADVPESGVATLEASSLVGSVTRDARVHMNDYNTYADNGVDPKAELGSLYNVAHMVSADDLWEQGISGAGIDVAVLDTGVAPVPGLVGQYVNGPDLSLDAMGPGTAGLDAFGHGTAMASIIAGRDAAAPTNVKDLKEASNKAYVGIAPGARVVNVKIGAFDGGSDVSQVIAGIDWVVQHAHDDGRNIRVINLSFGTDGVQDYLLDPLTYATEVAWRKGIVVVVSAGNDGFGTTKLDNPAYDPYVMAVGAADPNTTAGTADDFIADFSSRGDLTRRPDFMAPGVKIVGLRDPGSFLDTMYPAARRGDRFFRGSGTSQAAAVVSGATALLLQKYPNMTPDMVKAAFAASGVPLKTSKGVALEQGAKRIDVKAASDKTPDVLSGKIRSAQTFPIATGLGSLDASRGSYHLVDANGVALTGEVDLFGDVWDGRSWSASAWDGRSWSGDAWLGRSWSGSTWSGSTWSGGLWDGRSWSGSTWSGSTWSGSTWSGSTWSGSTWSGSTWSGSTWSGSTWSSSGWDQ